MSFRIVAALGNYPTTHGGCNQNRSNGTHHLVVQAGRESEIDDGLMHDAMDCLYQTQGSSGNPVIGAA
jgi:hypothetical protein